MTDRERALGLACALLYDTLERLGSPDNPPTADEIQAVLAQLAEPLSLTDLVLLTLPKLAPSDLLKVVAIAQKECASKLWSRR